MSSRPNLPRPQPGKESSAASRLSGGWQEVGSLALPPGPEAGEGLSAWLAETLSRFSLPPELVGQIMRSVREAAERPARQRPAQLAVFTPAALASRENQAWSFFRITKHHRTVEVYLYPEED